jgi:hypothetical protein
MPMPFLRATSRIRFVGEAERSARFRLACVPYTDRGWAVRLASFA